MNYRMIAQTLGLVLFIFAALMLLPMICGLVYGENILNFIAAAAIGSALGFVLTRFKPKTRTIYAREGFVLVGLSWILMGLIGALPFVISGDIPNYIDAVFETISGLTTTGASILTDIESLSRSGLFWRSFTHWIGGMGVLVFVLAVLPMSGDHSMHIMRAEAPGPTVGKLVPRVRRTAMILYLIYGAFTVAETILLMLGGMSFYDALLHAFGTAGTGGFSTRAASIAAFDSAYIEMVMASFLVLFGCNFNLYYLVLIGRVKDVFKNEELRFFLGVIVTVTLAIALGIRGIYGSFLTALRHAFFNVMSLMSTAGFCTVDYIQWPAYTHILIVFLMFIGGCAGSTGGGLKVSRVLLLFKSAIADLARQASPRSVRRVQMDGRRVDGGTLKVLGTFFFLYLVILLVSTLIVSVDGYDFSTNFTAALSCLSNVGPGLGQIGPTGGFYIFSPMVKALMSLVMLIGRLEIFPILLLFTPAVWKRK